MLDLQQALALAVVLLVVAIAIWRRWRRRDKSGAACHNCDAAGNVKKPKEVTLRFYRRKP